MLASKEIIKQIEIWLPPSKSYQSSKESKTHKKMSKIQNMLLIIDKLPKLKCNKCILYQNNEGEKVVSGPVSLRCVPKSTITIFLKRIQD